MFELEGLCLDWRVCLNWRESVWIRWSVFGWMVCVRIGGSVFGLDVVCLNWMECAWIRRSVF